MLLVQWTEQILLFVMDAHVRAETVIAKVEIANIKIVNLLQSNNYLFEI